MQEYSSYAKLDDRILNDGDVGFVGFNNRLRPDQLQGGMLADAQNMRFDRNGEAQVRKGIEVIEAPFAVGGDVLRLPTTAQLGSDPVIGDGVTAMLPTTIESATLVGADNQANIIINDPAVEAGHTFVATDVVTVEGLSPSGSSFTVDPNGLKTLVSVTDNGDTKTLKYALTGSNETYTTPIVLPQQLPFTLNTNTTQAVIGFNMVLDEGAVTEVYASTDFSDPNENASQYILIASNLKVVAKNLATNATVDIAYPAGETVPLEASMLQAFNKVFIFRKGQVALEWDGSFSGTPAFTKVASGTYTQPVALVTPASGFSINNNVATVDLDSGTHGLSEGDTITLLKSNNSGLTVGDAFVVSTVVDANEFKFFVNSPDVAAHTGTVPEFSKRVSVGLGFTHMPAPEFAVYHQRRLVMPFQFSVTGTNTYTSRGILDEVIASDILDSDTYDQIYAQYRFNAGEADFTVGLHSFSEDNLMVFNRNSIHLISNTTSLQSASTKLLTDEVGCVARNSIQQIGNQVIFLSDNGVYSTQFFDEYNLRGTETPLSEPINETIKRINTDQRSQAVAVYFDNRYFIAVPVNKFRDSRTTNQVPGEFITKADALLAGIPRESIEDSIALRNNVILIYNFLNKQWESVDSVNSTDWDIQNLIVAGEGSKRGVYAMNQLGGIHKIDSRLQGDDLINVSIGGSNETKDVKGSITTRQYTFGNMSRKNWKEFQMHVESSADNNSNFDLSAETENPDGTFPLGTLNSFNGNANLLASEDVSIRGRIGNRRGHGIQFTVNNTQGRPRIRSLQTQGSTSFRSTQKAE